MLIIHDVTSTFVILSEFRHFTSWIISVLCFFMYNIVLWMSILTYFFVWVFVMHSFVRMTIHILMGFCHVHVCTNDYPFPCGWFFVMHSSVRRTIHFFWMGFRHVHVSVQMTTISFWMNFCHARFCANDYLFFLNGFLSCSFLFGWLPSHFEWIIVMYISVRMTIHSFLNGCSSCTCFYEWLSHSQGIG